MSRAVEMRWIAPLGRVKVAVVLLQAVLATCLALGQAGFEDDRVMLQGFYWESGRFGHTERYPQMGNLSWYQIVESKVPDIAGANFDRIWLPPPARLKT